MAYSRKTSRDQGVYANRHKRDIGNSLNDPDTDERNLVKRRIHEFYVVIGRDEEGYFVGEVPQLKGCYSQGKNLDDLMANMREVIELCLDDEDAETDSLEFVGVQRVVV